MRVLGAFLIVSCGVFMGFDKYISMKKRYENLRLFLEFIIEIENNLKFYGDDLRTIITKSNNYIAVKIKEEMKNATLLSACESAGFLIFSDKNDYGLFRSFFQSFGRFDTESELCNAEKYKEETRLKITEAKKEFNEKGKIRLIYSLFLSFSLAILLI